MTNLVQIVTKPFKIKISSVIYINFRILTGDLRDSTATKDLCLTSNHPLCR